MKTFVNVNVNMYGWSAGVPKTSVALICRVTRMASHAPLVVASVTLTIQRSRAGHGGDSAVKLEIITMTRSNVCLSAPTPPWPENLRTSERSWRERETGDSDASPTRLSHIIKHDSVEHYNRGSALHYDFMNNCTLFRNLLSISLKLLLENTQKVHFSLCAVSLNALLNLQS